MHGMNRVHKPSKHDMHGCRHVYCILQHKAVHQQSSVVNKHGNILLLQQQKQSNHQTISEVLSKARLQRAFKPAAIQGRTRARTTNQHKCLAACFAQSIQRSVYRETKSSQQCTVQQLSIEHSTACIACSCNHQLVVSVRINCSKRSYSNQ